jgi:serine phosphatase RsbU (regulator of sigma subunit)
MLSAPINAHPTSPAPHSSLPVRTPEPINLPPLQGLDIQARYLSARTGGDFFDVLAIGPHLVFLLSDIAGTRTSAHSIAAYTQDTFRRRVPELFGTPGANLTDAIATLAHDINRTLTSSTTHGVCFAPTFLACFDLSLSILTYINAGGQPAIFRDSDGTRVLTNACMPLGLFSHLTYEPAFQAFEPGARLLLVTKGVVEERRGKTPFGAEHVTHLLKDSTTNSAFDLCQTILNQAHQVDKPSWYHLPKLRLTKPKRTEDLTAVALVRPA